MNQGRSAPQLLRAKQVSREQECEREYEALQRNHRSKFGDDDTAREAAGSAAMLRAKELMKVGQRVDQGGQAHASQTDWHARASPHVRIG